MIPKKNELVRPLSMLKFTDLIVYQAIVNTLADFSYDKIAGENLSYNSYQH